MSRLLIDTNIVIDLLSKRDKFYDEAADLFSRAEEAREILRKFKVLVELLSLDDKITELALSDDNFPDFEDGLQYYSAIENQIDIIITRNKKDFKNSKIPILTAKEFLARK